MGRVHRELQERFKRVHIAACHTGGPVANDPMDAGMLAGASEEEMIALAIAASLSESPIGGPGASPRPHCQGLIDDQAIQCETHWGGVLSALSTERANGRRLATTRGAGANREQRAEIRRFLLSVASDAPLKDDAGPHLSAVLQHPDLKEVILREFDCTRHYLRRGEKPKLRVLGLRYGVTESAIRKTNDLEGRPVPVGSGHNFLYIPPSEHDTSAPTRITRSELTAKLREASR
jgi:hypothetical protein